MPNPLDEFIERGNLFSETIMGDPFTYDGTEYVGTVSDLTQDEFYNEDGMGSRKNAERLLEVALSQFAASSVPAIKKSVIYEGETYQIIEIMSLDTTNVVYKIRSPLQTA